MNRTEEIIDLCREILAGMLRSTPADIRPQDTFAGLGLDSAAAVHFMLHVEEKTGLEFDPGVTEEHPSVEAFATFVAGLLEKSA